MEHQDTPAIAKQSKAGLVIRSLRIVTGLYLLAYVSSHLLNLSFGLHSVSAMDAARPYLSGLWTGPVTGRILVISLLIHFLLGLWTIYKRPTFRASTQDVVQLITGLLVIPLMATHAIGISMVQDAGVDFGYAQAIPLFWVQNPSLGLLQVAMLTVVWVHGCAGLFTWLRSKESARSVLLWLYPLAVAVPVVALLGYAEAGRGALIKAHPPVTKTAYEAPSQAAEPYPQQTTTQAPPAVVVPFQLIKQITNWVIWISALMGILTLLARWIRISIIRSENVYLTRAGAGPMASTSAITLLDGFRTNNQPHASLCEGRGRCGTCAVRIIHSEFPLPAPNELELRTLRRIEAPPEARLACQVMAAGGRVDVDPLYPADYTFHDDKPEPAAATSDNAQVTV